MHWTWDYLHHGIAWSIVQRIMSDLPTYEYDPEKPAGEDEVKLTKDNADAVLFQIKNMI